MAIPQNPNVYMETMEETENQGEEPAENGSAGSFGMAGRKPVSYTHLDVYKRQGLESVSGFFFAEQYR